jgi:alpha-tubulin suppressor-like RCC1 family protein
MVTTGIQFGLAIKQDGTLWSWGLNNDGQSGLNDTIARYVPIVLV